MTVCGQANQCINTFELVFLVEELCTNTCCCLYQGLYSILHSPLLFIWEFQLPRPTSLNGFWRAGVGAPSFHCLKLGVFDWLKGSRFSQWLQIWIFLGFSKHILQALQNVDSVKSSSLPVPLIILKFLSSAIQEDDRWSREPQNLVAKLSLNVVFVGKKQAIKSELFFRELCQENFYSRFY